MSGRSRFDKGNPEVISRAKIKNAPYNPRQMDRESAERLRKSLSQHGLVELPIWNARTGNLVGGHQRISQLDALEGRKDYELMVNVIDVDEREEAQLNVKLNNPDLQGDWDFQKLADLADEFSLDFEDMGFSDISVDMMFEGDERFSALLANDDVNGAESDMAEIKAARERIREDSAEKDGVDYFVTVVFHDEKAKKRFMQAISINTWEQYVTLEQVLRLLNLDTAQLGKLREKGIDVGGADE
jgi:hypothetical protein